MDKCQKEEYEFKILATNNNWRCLAALFNQNIRPSALVSLDLSIQRIKTIPNCFRCLIGLQKLSFYNNIIGIIQNLETLILLTQLSLYSNLITKIQNLQTLTSLTILKLDYNKIQKIENLENLTQLIKLTLLGNQISKIQNLQNLTLLTELNLGSNLISKIQNLKTNVLLETLNLDSNKISKIENLETLISIERFSLFDNHIKKIQMIRNQNLLKTNFYNLQFLQHLSLTENLILTIQGILYVKMPNLINLELNKNQISNFRALRRIYFPLICQLLLGNNKINQFNQFNELKSQKLSIYQIGQYIENGPKIQDIVVKRETIQFKIQSFALKCIERRQKIWKFHQKLKKPMYQSEYLKLSNQLL